MKNLFLGLCLSMILCFGAKAQYVPRYNMEDTNNNESIIYVFFNNEPCQECAEAVELIEQLYASNFENMYKLYLINYQDEAGSGFAQDYDLTQPLEVVMVKKNVDGLALGHQKINNLLSMVSIPSTFDDYFLQYVQNYLGNNY